MKKFLGLFCLASTMYATNQEFNDLWLKAYSQEHENNLWVSFYGFSDCALQEPDEMIHKNTILISELDSYSKKDNLHKDHQKEIQQMVAMLESHLEEIKQQQLKKSHD